MLKAENLQPTGSFKLRGAIYAVSKLNKDQLAQGVVAYSSGNHAIGVAFAAKCLGTKAVLIIPKDIPKKKLTQIQSYESEIIFYDRILDNREEMGEELCHSRGLTLIKPYDDIDTICGQGTCGLEVSEQIDVPIDSAVICAGGGGLAAGVGSYLKYAFPNIKLYTAEPIGWDDHKISLETGKRVFCENTHMGICDGVLTPIPGEKTYEINRKIFSSGLAVSEDKVIGAMKLAFQEFKIKLEPSGAVALACVIENLNLFHQQTVLVTLSGGNVDEERFSECFN